MVEAGGFEPPSVQESPKHLRVYSVFYSHRDGSRQTGAITAGSHVNLTDTSGYPMHPPARCRRLFRLAGGQRTSVTAIKPRRLIQY